MTPTMYMAFRPLLVNNLWVSVSAVTNIYTANELNQYFLISNHVNHVNPVQISPVYDLDGNMTWDGRFNYTYDAENRLVAAYSNGLCVVSNAYDHMSRRVLKVTPTATHTYLYDDWNLVQETISTASGTTTNHYVWGRDLSGSMQGAGGVGGLLAVSLNGAWYFPFYDNNGNITAYVDENGTIVAEYAYDAFGCTIEATSSMADTFAFRFSTKYHDSETGLVMYQLRNYCPLLGRWLSRDPLGDEAFLQQYTSDMNRSESKHWRERSLRPTYLFVQNNPLLFSDYLGLDLTYSGCKCCPEIDDAVRRANRAIREGTCKEWFKEHGHNYSLGTPSRSVACHGNWKIPCMLGFAAWTMPGMGIGVCDSKCKELDSVTLASLLVHELAHHYCTYGLGRENCAISAQQACSEALMD
jgi:RHS repeat-associated protein